MNERIKELFNQAGGQGAIHPLKYNGTLNVELFAELIVRECMDVASPNYMSTPEQGVYYVEQAIARIAEHFGVE